MKPDSKEIFGGEIQYYRLDPEVWETIIKRFAETGLKTVTAYTPWNTHMIKEPSEEYPDGVYDFTGETDPKLNLYRFLELVEKYGLNLNFRCGPFVCAEMNYGGYPRFLCMDTPEIYCYDSEGKPTKGYWIAIHEGAQPSYLHPLYLDWTRKWINEVDKIILPHLKVNGGCITMVNLDNEISYIVQDSLLASDYNHVNTDKGGFYHQFLTEKYGVAENLPYGRKYVSIEDVEPPRKVPDTVDADFAWYTDWMYFKTWCMTKYIDELRKMHEANGINETNVIFMTNLNPHLPEGIPARMPDFEKATHGIIGYDFYRGVFMSYSGYQSMARVLKLMNDSCDYTYSAEFMSGTWTKEVNERVSDDHMRFMARCALAQGCKAIDWYMFHDRDTWGDAPVSCRGHKRPSIDVLTETPKILFDKIKNWDRLVPVNDVGVIYDLAAHTHTGLGDPMPCADNDYYVGKPEINGIKAGVYSKEYVGMFRLAEQNGMQAAAIDTTNGTKHLRGLKLAVFPGSPIISKVSAKAIDEYCEEGGTLLFTGTLPVIYDDGTAADYSFIKPGKQAYKNGNIVYLDRWIGQNGAEQDLLEDIAEFGKIADEAGVVPAVRIMPDGVIEWVNWGDYGTTSYTEPRNLGSAILHTDGDEKILFVLNHYMDAWKFNLEFGFDCDRLECLTEEDDVDIVNGKATVDIDRKSCQIYRIKCR